MYAIVKAGGHQEKVSVGSVITVNRLEEKQGDGVQFPVVLKVDDSKAVSTSGSAKGEVLQDDKLGKKIVIQKFHNKTGGARRHGHRQKLSVVKITSIE
ncbi:MAG: 50S ribosomal protein L21 [Aeriscardovia sp.]|nr:50S ribosomal protein L21 [Aeriscardovia sp.]